MPGPERDGASAPRETYTGPAADPLVRVRELEGELEITRADLFDATKNYQALYGRLGAQQNINSGLVEALGAVKAEVAALKGDVARVSHKLAERDAREARAKKRKR